MSKLTIGIIREGKVPPDKRVPLTPAQCAKLKRLYPGLEILVQSSPIRAFADDSYRSEGIAVVDSLESCDVIMGIKEVRVEDLIPNKTFIFFSHTIKKQPYNRKLLQAIVAKKIRLIDYEVLKDKNNKRIIGFGRYAGIVGCYNGFLTYGLKNKLYKLKPAHECADRKEMEEELKKVKLPDQTRIVLTGFGRVGHGAREVLDLLPITEVSPDEYLSGEFPYPVFSQLEAEDYYARKDGKAFDKADFYANPELYRSTFSAYIDKSDMYIPCHFWSKNADYIVKREDLNKEGRRITVVADISCDVNGPIACTIRSSKIGDSIFGFNPLTNEEDDYMKDDVIAVMAVDNLPCELPMDASENFGNELIKEVIPHLMKGDPDGVLERGTETDFSGGLTSNFSYLQNYLDEKE